jgi:hypothetical protein
MSYFEIRDACLRDASFVAANMREQDAVEIDAVVDMSNPAGVAAWLLNGSGAFQEDPALNWARIAYLKGQPVAVFGIARIAPHIGSAWAYGTRVLPRVAKRISLWGMGFYPPAMINAGIRRVEVRTMACHDLSHRWLASMGAVLETPEPFEYGRNGELFVQYAWTRATWRDAAGRAARARWGRSWAAEASKTTS